MRRKSIPISLVSTLCFMESSNVRGYGVTAMTDDRDRAPSPIQLANQTNV
ncbi:MAG TPA: hypothetical protein VGQ39_10210 [Pyrinomonadaceae bacterium]|nr:hypothetical protein [Pyrinomonadaceae bacterium]